MVSGGAAVSMTFIWLIAMVVLLVIEGVVPGLVSIWFAAGALVALVFGVGAARAPGLWGHLCGSAHGAPVLTGGTGYGRQVTCSGFIFRDGITACGLGENGGR